MGALGRWGRQQALLPVRGMHDSSLAAAVLPWTDIFVAAGGGVVFVAHAKACDIPVDRLDRSCVLWRLLPLRLEESPCCIAHMFQVGTAA